MRSHRATVVLAGFALLLAAAGCGGTGSKSPDPTWSVWGTMTGDAVEGVTMTLGGDGSGTTVTGTDGVYVFTGLPTGTYSITPYCEGCTFIPPNRIVMLGGADIVGQDFVSSGTPPTLNTDPPTDPVRLVFIHHSCGTNWLNTTNGALGNALGANNYYVRDLSYGWDAPQNTDIGSQTDIGHWYTWFADTVIQGNLVPRRDNICGALYTTNSTAASYTPIVDPGGENAIILFKSCYPNSNVNNDNAHPPADLYGNPCSNAAHTLPNCKEIYRQILTYFKAQHHKLFVVVTAPPLVSGSTLLTQAANARSLNNWLVHNWLVEADWGGKNVAVFDFYNVLTDPDNHHRVFDGAIEHETGYGDNFSAYGTGGDSHPNVAGNQKATDEFLLLLNVAYNRWQAWLP